MKVPNTETLKKLTSISEHKDRLEPTLRKEEAELRKLRAVIEAKENEVSKIRHQYNELENQIRNFWTEDEISSVTPAPEPFEKNEANSTKEPSSKPSIDITPVFNQELFSEKIEIEKGPFKRKVPKKKEPKKLTATDRIRILLEGKPEGLNIDELAESTNKTPGKVYVWFSKIGKVKGFVRIKNGRIALKSTQPDFNDNPESQDIPSVLKNF